MIRSLYTAVSGMITLENKQNTIANNMANANTIGYKSEDLVLKSFPEVMLQNRDKIVGNKNVVNKLGTLSLGTKIDEVTTKFTQGDFKETGKTTDFAIDGRGFFMVQNGNNVVYTRDGNFKVNTDGLLITTTGDRVLGRNAAGELEPIYVGDSDFVIDKYNNVQINGVSTQSLATADFEDYSTLVKIGDNYYQGENPINDAAVYVKQGFTEASNVNITNEMVNMMTVMRNFETNQKILTMLDGTLDKAANKVGQV
ncbi:MAG: flagellar basal body rod protein FlgG [Clostridiales bacterium]|mgnify:CR=1 FL=1|nr:flagellar basal body rod protein FlgG [Clostridiales bacterium]